MFLLGSCWDVFNIKRNMDLLCLLVELAGHGLWEELTWETKLIHF